MGGERLVTNTVETTRGFKSFEQKDLSSYIVQQFCGLLNGEKSAFRDRVEHLIVCALDAAANKDVTEKSLYEVNRLVSSVLCPPTIFWQSKKQRLAVSWLVRQVENRNSFDGILRWFLWLVENRWFWKLRRCPRCKAFFEAKREDKVSCGRNCNSLKWQKENKDWCRRQHTKYMKRTWRPRQKGLEPPSGHRAEQSEADRLSRKQRVGH